MDPGTQRFIEALRSLGYEPRILELPAGTATAREAAAAVGTDLRQIAKTLLFQAGEEPFLVIAAGHNRVDTRKLAAMLGGKVRMADPKFTTGVTGYPVGGVPPLGHPRPLKTFIDEDLLACDVVYAGAGSPHTLFPVKPKELLDLTGGKPADIKR